MLDSETKLYCIFGNPVRHSFSPVIQNKAFQVKGINAVYAAFEINNLEDAVKGIRAIGIGGASITIPFKTDIMKHLDKCDAISTMIGSVNTVINNGGYLTGTNTDGWGFYKALSSNTEIGGKRVAVFGSGGTSRPVCFSLLYYDKPQDITIFARNNEKRDELKNNLIKHMPEFGNKIFDYPLSDWPKYKDDYDILINTTPVGMYPDYNGSIIGLDDMPENKSVMDIVYRPHKTKFIEYAAVKGCQITYGIDMLLYQGVRQFELWTGEEAPIDDMRFAVYSIINY